MHLDLCHCGSGSRSEPLTGSDSPARRVRGTSPPARQARPARASADRPRWAAGNPPADLGREEAGNIRSTKDVSHV